MVIPSVNITKNLIDIFTSLVGTPPGSNSRTGVQVDLDTRIRENDGTYVPTLHHSPPLVLVDPAALLVHKDVANGWIGGDSRNRTCYCFTTNLTGHVMAVKIHRSVDLTKYGLPYHAGHRLFVVKINT